MPFDPTIAAIRFGMGLPPTIAPPASVDDMLTRLAGSDEIGAAIPIPTFSIAQPSPEDFRIATRARNAVRGTDAEAAAEDVRDALRSDSREAVAEHMKASIARAVYTHDGFRERLALFCADHFTVRATAAIRRHLVSPYIEEAIRPHVAGRFADMLVAVVGSPMMIVYLDQNRSMGPNSRSALRRDGGLNENLAREVLELHTLGVGGAYTQDDVRQFAELLTGVTANAQRGGFFQENRAEPGSETVLGVTYGGDEDSLDHVNAALRDIAMHPDTARHLAQKLAVHFIGPDPENALVVAMAARYLATDGTLFAMYEVLLADEAAWSPVAKKVKQPFEFIASSMRALGVPQAAILAASLQQVRRWGLRPLGVMGQTWQNPVGPDGWPEDDENWITPQGMAGRITWSMQAPQEMLETLPDPSDFVYRALGPNPPEAVIFAANAAETVKDGIGIVLASAAFQRR
ncbi:hypothetical protein DUF1800 [Octadecabacter arcticus 238]|uniref:DUF1800 family protein n=1 Tax=Octadecabacter arcticus 238 TaxID=391616 RepID=M9RNM9_9RHOB|nr:DUF1800 domain-containing protein [Octadecabacter arcticus]AGI73353.1 hypothetical protein DUF1800 [Octadecabacter arcticus 238]